MYALATCRGSILRGTTTNAFLDAEDNDTVVASGVLARIKTTSRRVFDSATQTARVVDAPAARMQSDTDIRPGDRFRDDTNGGTYAVINVTQPDQQGRDSDLRIELRKVKKAE